VLDRGSVVGQFRKDEVSLEELVNRLYLVARTGKLTENETSTVACDQPQNEIQSKMP
jgi:simple sugar transport system ATP-binding protein